MSFFVAIFRFILSTLGLFIQVIGDLINWMLDVIESGLDWCDEHTEM